MLAIGCDHAGYELKLALLETFKALKLKYKDYGTDSATPCDYPDFARAVCESIQGRVCDRGVLICGTGIGMSIAANKFVGIRAALCYEEDLAVLSRKHNNSNVLALGARVTSREKAKNIFRLWIAAEYTDARHDCRLDKIADFEKH
jgi:RpiB/LacA/LacB family sugar-phosphate isomerase